MNINPSNNSNSKKDGVRNFITTHSKNIKKKSSVLWSRFLHKGKQKMTVMFIPHSEKKIINFHISIFTISGILVSLVITIIITSAFIINHSSTIKEVSKLKKYRANSKETINAYKKEIYKLQNTVENNFKGAIEQLYLALTRKNPKAIKNNVLWAKGGVSNVDPLKQDLKNLPSTDALTIREINSDLKRTKKLLNDFKNLIENRKKIIENTPSIWPVDGFIVSRWGNRNSPYSFRKEFHQGIDIKGFPGKSIRATAPGTISNIKWDRNLGLTISIKHKYGFVTSYSHCQRVTVEKGQKVSKSEIIGYIGKTGKTTKYICYYQIKVGTDFVNPLPYLNRILL